MNEELCLTSSTAGTFVQKPFNLFFLLNFMFQAQILAAIPIVLFLRTSVSSVAAQSVPLTEIYTGSNSLNHDISNFYNCVTDTHKDPPSISVVDQCYSDNVQGGGSSGSGSDLSSSSSDSSHIEFHHFSDQPPSFITHGFDFHHFDSVNLNIPTV
jgi:hypothetical protein